jgi:hypothetical protein
MAGSMAIRALLGRALAVGLTIAAGTAIFALLSGSFDETDGRIIATSLGFSVFSATAATGAASRRAGSGWEHTVGGAALVLSGAAFLILGYAIWADSGNEVPWQLWGVVAVAALATSHASAVLRARRRDDGDLVRVLVVTSIVAAALDALFAMAAIAELVQDVSAAEIRIAAVSGVVMLLASALPPILRRVAPPGEGAARASSPFDELAEHVIASTDRMLAMRPEPELRRECERLREAARRIGS